MSRQKQRPGMQLGMAHPQTAMEHWAPLRGLGPLTQFFPTHSTGDGNNDGGGEKYRHPTTSATIFSTATPYESVP